MSLGDFDTGNFNDLPTTQEVILVWFLHIVASLFIVIVILNLLIALMGDTFSRVLENITNLSIRERVMLVSENENLFDREALFKNA